MPQHVLIPGLQELVWNSPRVNIPSQRYLGAHSKAVTLLPDSRIQAKLALSATFPVGHPCTERQSIQLCDVPALRNRGSSPELGADSELASATSGSRVGWSGLNPSNRLRVAPNVRATRDVV